MSKDHPNLDRLRAMREAQFSGRRWATAPAPALDCPQCIELRAEVSALRKQIAELTDQLTSVNRPVNKPDVNNAELTIDGLKAKPEASDRKAYMRDYMRKRRLDQSK
jgi:hypothetical protein